jgi:uncharacterized membrane protein YccF (DUF307 family)
MTATQSAPLGFPENLFVFLRRIGVWLTKGILAIAIITMAGIIAIATAAAGIVLASIALMTRLSGKTNTSKTTYHETANGEGITLEARKTPRGWTVE